MPVIQPVLDIPSSYQAMLDSGELWRDGGVLRRVANGTIALILKDGVAPDDKTRVISQSAQNSIKKIDMHQFVKDHRGATATGITGLVVSIGVCIYLYVDKKKSDKALEETARRVSDFRLAIIHYLKMATSGCLTTRDIKKLLSTVDELEQVGVTIDVSEDEMRDLMNCIISYTHQLAEANSYELNTVSENEKCSIASLKSNLETQMKILNSVL